jgi:predicted phage terminase large subunit-like protein
MRREDDPAFEAEYLVLLEAEDYARAEASLSHFIKASWHVLEPGTPFLDNWHIDYVAEHLEAVYSGEIKRLLINEPPRHMKSIQCTVCFPAWTWIKKPELRIVSASYSGALSIKHNTDRRSIIESPWYQRAWGRRFSLSADQNQKSEFMNSRRGHMLATSVGTTALGKGGNILIWDDPINPQDAASEKGIEEASIWLRNFVTRLDNKKSDAIIGTMQRLSAKDPSAQALAEGGWTHICLPAEAPRKTIIIFPKSGRQVVREEGELLWPEREGPAEIAMMKKALGPYYGGQYNQDPKPQDGGFFNRSWWKYYKELPMRRIRRVQFWDCAEKPGVTNDFSVCATWDQTESGYYLVDCFAGKLSFPALKATAKSQYAAHSPDAVVIEDKSAGVQLIQELQADTTLPVLLYDPGQRDKIVRAAGAQPTVMAGNCYLPESRPFVEVFLSRHEKFPNDDHDDEVDTTSMMVEFFKSGIAVPRVRSL